MIIIALLITMMIMRIMILFCIILQPYQVDDHWKIRIKKVEKIVSSLDCVLQYVPTYLMFRILFIHPPEAKVKYTMTVFTKFDTVFGNKDTIHFHIKVIVVVMSYKWWPTCVSPTLKCLMIIIDIFALLNLSIMGTGVDVNSGSATRWASTNRPWPLCWFDNKEIKWPLPVQCNKSYLHRADFRFAPSQWETALLCSDLSHWLGTSHESALLQPLLGLLLPYNVFLIRSLRHIWRPLVDKISCHMILKSIAVI